MRFSIAVILIASVALLTSSCGTYAGNSNQPVFLYNHSMQAFEFSANCPNGCFLGIKPLVTTAAQALRMLQHSPDIDHSSIAILYDNGNRLEEHVTDSSLQLLQQGGMLEARWTPTSDRQWGFEMGIEAPDGIVQSLSAEPIDTHISDFEKVLGEPDKIRVDGFMPPDAPYEIGYWLYYSNWKVILTNTLGGSIDGPKVGDRVDGVILNYAIQEAEYKPWQGYGKMAQYMSPEQLQDYEQFTGDYRFGPPPPTATPTMIPQARSYACQNRPPCGAATAQVRLPSYIDQLAFEQTIRDFATGVERRDYASAEQYATPDFAAYLDGLANGTGAAADGFSTAILHSLPLKLLEVKPYYDNGQCPPDFNTSSDRPTVSFLVQFEYVDAQGNKAQAGGYVQGVKGADGNYRIGGFASCT